MHDVIDRLITLKATDGLQYFNGISVAGGLSVMYREYVEAHSYGAYCGPNGSLDPDGAACQAIVSRLGLTDDEIDAANSLYLLSTTVNDGLQNPNATYVTTVLNVDPFSNDGTDWLVQARDIIR